MNLRVLIVDDEPPARRRIRGLLLAEADVDVVGECRDGLEAIGAIKSLRPDLVFLDVQMPEANGFDVLAALAKDELPAVVFVTAYDHYALQAFDAHALDYLLKPFDAARFEAALRRAREHVARGASSDARMAALLEELRHERRWLERIPIRVDDRMRMLSVADIDYFEAAGSYVRIHAGTRSYLLRATLSRFEARLDPRRFARLHRSHIVNIDRVHELEPLFQGEFVLMLRNGQRLNTGRTYRDRVRRAFNLDA